jgi:acyl transferase domain-containing protein
VNGVNGVNGVNHEISNTNGVDGVNHAISKPNGINGVNGVNHTISKSSKATPGYQLLTWSARDEAALKRMLHLYDGYLKTSTHGDADFLGNLAYTLAARRTLMAWRSFSIVDEQGAPETLDLPAAKCERAARDVGVAFIFTGQGAQYANMGMELLRYPIFKATLIEIDSIFQQLGAEWSLFGK